MTIKPGDVVDIKGVPIYPGDLIRSYHFTGARRKRHYLYHVAIWNSDEVTMELVPTSELEPTLRDRGGRCWLRQELADEIVAEVISGHGPGDCLDYTDRPKRRRATA